MIGSHESSAPGRRPWRAHLAESAYPAAHLLGLWAFAVAQPLYDILQRHGEFFIAHRTQPLDMAVYIGLVSVGVPLLIVVPWIALATVWPRAGRIVLNGLVGLLSMALVSQILAYRVPLPVAIHFALAGAVGIAAAWAYASRAGVRTFLTMLSPSVVVFPVIFLMHPSMAMFMRSDEATARPQAAITGPAPPIVFLIFDQLPLVSLLDSQGQIDRDRYPGFAALADTATWYRNATTVAEFTGWAVPPIVSGMMPSPTKVPTTKSYPQNLFTWLGGRYRFEVHEPITQLCPERLCDANRAPLPVRMAGMVLDSSVVYLNVALPAGLRALLPPMTENWRGFIQNQRWQRRWVTERDQDRREVPRGLIASIDRRDPQPTLYFAHSLLPHEPYVYFRSGREFASDTRLVGLNQVGRWTTDPWTVTLAYRRHLLQVEYVDGLIGQVIERLTAEGMYDDALIVVTSDHGVSFRPGQYFKGLEAANLPDIMSVPLLIKAPRQRQGRVDDSNVQSVDVMPTIAALLNVPLTWTPDGKAAGAADRQTQPKTIRHGGARIQTAIETDVLARKRAEAVARKVAQFGEGPGWRGAAAAHADLLGRRVETLDATEGPWQVLLDDVGRLFAVDPAGAEVPALLEGHVRDARGAPVDAVVAVAVNGVVSAVARTYRSADAAQGSWAAVVDPTQFTKGRNDVRVYVIAPDTGRLHLAFSSRARPDTTNLSSRGAQDFWAVTQSGFYPREGQPIPHRWTNGAGSLVVPIDTGQPSRSLRIGVTGVAPGGTALTLTLNDCTLFSGRVDAAPWYRTFSLKACPPSTLAQPHATITVTSPTWVAPPDTRTRGVAVETLNLFEQDWPLTADPGLADRAAVKAAETSHTPQEAGTPLPIVVANTGESTWLSPNDEGPASLSVQIALRWRPARGTGPMVEQRMDLPRALHPTDRVLIEAPIVPPDALRQQGPWKVTITPVRSNGTPVPADHDLVVDVSATRP